MPRTEDIERFTQVLNSLGDEPAIRAARSETIDDVPAPEEQTSTPGGGELDSLGPTGEGAETGSPAESEGLQDIFDSLSSLPDEDAAGQAGAEQPGRAAAAAGGPSAPAPADEGLDFSSLFGEEGVPEGIEELEKPAPPPQARSRGAGRAPQPEPPVAQDTLERLPDEDAFSLPAGEAGSLEADLSQMETLPDEEAQGELGTPAESFDLPDLGDLSFSEPTEGPAAPASSTEPSFEEPMPSLDEPVSFDEPAPSPDEPGLSLDEPVSFDEPLSSPGETLSLEEPAPPLGEPLSSLEEPALDQAALQGVDLDNATLPDQFPPAMPSEAPVSAGGLAQAPVVEMESLGEESLDDLNLDQFSLPQSAEEFGTSKTPPAEPTVRPAATTRRPAERGRQRPQPRAAAASSQPALGAGQIELTPEQFARLKKTLESLPRNLKIVVQDLIGEGTAAGADLAALVNLLLRDASAQEIAALAGRISGKRIRIPAGYEKKTGAAFEAEQRTFAYAFRENFLPLLRVVAITLLAGGLFGFLGYNYVYRPLFAFTNYRTGYTQILNDRYTLANERFARATSVWPLKGWYYRYAEAFAAKRQYVLAEKKYDDLLKAYPGDKKGIIDYAGLESTKLSDYEKADSLLKSFLDAHQDDYDALLASGDNDLLWAERDKSKIEAARLAYAILLNKYGESDTLLFRMLRFFIRTDNGAEVERLRAFYASRPDVTIDAPVFAELGGYFVDHRRLDYVQEVLFRADKAQPGLYQVHYNLARYYRIVQNSADEKKALDATVKLLDRTRRTDAITRGRLTVEIDTHTRLGEYHYKMQEYIPAERELLLAISLVENNQKNKLIGRDRLYGRPYAVLGDLYYYVQGDLQTAALQFQNAISNLYTDPLLTYKIGYVQYRQEDYKSALATFSGAEDASAYPSGNEALAPVTDTAQPAAPTLPGQPPQNLLYALGDTFYQRGDYFAAQGYFLRVLDRLQSRRTAMGFLHPDERPDERALLDSLVRVNNNLGVTMFRLAERTGDRNKKSEALVYLSAASEIAASLARSPDTIKRSEDRSLPSLNMRGILYPVTGFVLQLSTALPKDFEAATW